MALSEREILEALATVQDPERGQSVTELGIVKDVSVLEGVVRLTLDLTGPDVATGKRREALGRAARDALGRLQGVDHVELRFQDAVPGRPITPDDPVPGARNIVLVMSGKGGVGKSTTATNLAMALLRSGYRVGLLDADIYGPSIPTMLGVTGRPYSVDGKSIEPLERFGLKLMSIGFLLEDPKAAVIWRGPMLHGALQQFLKDVHWGTLDYLVLDLPPGTGDVALTLSQRVKATGAVIVTTPQTVATDDVYKSVSMCQKVTIPILGVVENMSFFIDSAGVRHELFGSGGGQAIADFAAAPLLGQIPIDPSIREWGDKGTPVVQAAPGSAVAKAFLEVAERLVDHLASASDAADDGGAPIIDRSGGSGGRKRLPVMK